MNKAIEVGTQIGIGIGGDINAVAVVAAVRDGEVLLQSDHQEFCGWCPVSEIREAVDD